jgi:hypothetical protein
MPRETLSTHAPPGAAGSAAQRARTDEDHSGDFAGSTEADRVSPQIRPRLRMVVGGAPVIEPVVESAGRPVTSHKSSPNGEVLAQDWAKDWAEDWLEDEAEDDLNSPAARAEARLDNGGARAPFLAVVENRDGESRKQSAIIKKQGQKQEPQSAIRIEPGRRGLKKLNSKQIALDWPPTPRGCEWRRSDDGLNLWRCWTDWDDDKTKRIKKSRYAGHLSDDAWRIMKEYDHEAFISIVGERLRRHSGR